MVTMRHPAWCDPAFCTAPAERPTSYDGPHTDHQSCPMELEHFGASLNAVSVFRLEAYTAANNHGVFGWLTQGVAPWECATYLRIGLYVPEQGPTAFFSLEMSPHHMIHPGQPMSAGERLTFLCQTALADTVDRAEEALNELTRKVLARGQEER